MLASECIGNVKADIVPGLVVFEPDVSQACDEVP
jgi:hypothetical protein